MPWQQNPLNTAAGANVGSANSQDMFVGYGTEFNNPDRFILDISPIIHLLGADQTKLISWMQGTGTKPTSEIQFTHMENELLTVRDFSAKLVTYGIAANKTVLLELDSPQDWQAIETSPAGDGDWLTGGPPQIYMTVKNAAGNSFSVVIKKGALAGASDRYINDQAGNVSANAPGNKKDAIVIATSAATGVSALSAEVAAVPAAVGGGAFNIVNWATVGSVAVDVTVVTPEDHLQGMPQGSGLPNETRKKSRSLRNYVQIFKTPWTVTKTLKAVSMRGGDELGILRLRKTIQHKTALEYSMMFQAGGIDGVDYGVIDSTTENPLTRFKGLGVGLAATGLVSKPGWIVTKNADLNPDFMLSRSTATITDIHTLLSKVFDDLVDDPSETKIMLASNEWLVVLANLAGKQGNNGGFMFGDHTITNALGIPNIRTLTSPVGTLRMVPFKHLRGRFKDYAVILDMKNIKYRPLRPTQMLSNVGTLETDGQLDYMITEAGIQVIHESTHAVLKLVV